MIINGGSRCNSGWFTGHLTNESENERVRLCEIKNLAATTVEESFREMGAVASVTQCKNWFYHANINPRGNEVLTDEQWLTTIDRLETNLGLTGHARFVVEHKKHGRTHRHIIWSRINIDRLRAVTMTNDYESHQITARKIEEIFNLQPEESVFGKDRSEPRPERRPKNWEIFRGKKSGIDPMAMKDQITTLKTEAKDGAEFAEKIGQLGYMLARGDKANFCIVDKAGHVHSLIRRIANIRAAELNGFMAAVNKALLPSIPEARVKMLKPKKSEN